MMTRFNLPCLLLSVASLAAVVAAQVGQDELLRRRDLKIAEPWVKAGGWFTDYEAALAESKRSGKPVLAFFTRSYSPCAPCISLETHVMAKPAFTEFAREIVPFLHVTSLVEGEPHADLLMEKGGTGFPFLCFMNSSGHVMARHYRQRSVKAFRRTLKNEVREYLAIEKKALAGDADAKYLYLLRRLGLGVDYAIARKMADELIACKTAGELKSLSSDRRKRLEQKLTNLEYDELRETARQTRRYDIAGKRCAAMMKAGREPESSRRVIDFWSFVIIHARSTRDVPLFEDALKRMDKHSGDTPRVRAFMAERRVELEDLRAAVAASKKK